VTITQEKISLDFLLIMFGVRTLLLLDLMSKNELEEAIYLLRIKLFETVSVKGFLDPRTIEISHSLDLYLNRYSKIKSKGA
jgi:hypothetical protein